VKPRCETTKIDFFSIKKENIKNVGKKQVLFLQKKDGPAWH
jgi:hypothetical protein